LLSERHSKIQEFQSIFFKTTAKEAYFHKLNDQYFILVKVFFVIMELLKVKMSEGKIALGTLVFQNG